MLLLFSVLIGATHRPGTQHRAGPEREALHLLRYPGHGLSHGDSGDSRCSGQLYKNKIICI